MPSTSTSNFNIQWSYPSRSSLVQWRRSSRLIHTPLYVHVQSCFVLDQTAVSVMWHSFIRIMTMNEDWSLRIWKWEDQNRPSKYGSRLSRTKFVHVLVMCEADMMYVTTAKHGASTYLSYHCHLWSSVGVSDHSSMERWQLLGTEGCNREEPQEFTQVYEQVQGMYVFELIQHRTCTVRNG